MNEAFAKKVNCERSQIVLRKNDFPERVLKKMPFISQKSQEVQMEFADHLQKGLELWKTVLCADANKYNLMDVITHEENSGKNFGKTIV